MKSGTTHPIKKMLPFLKTTTQMRIASMMMKNGMEFLKNKSLFKISTLSTKVSQMLAIQGTVME